MRAAKLTVILLLISLLAACGFKLRGSAELPGYKLPFSTIALTLAPTTELYALLKRNIEASSPGTRVVDAKEAEAILTVLADTNVKNILSLNAAGRAREYQLVRSLLSRCMPMSPRRRRLPKSNTPTPVLTSWLPSTSRPAPSRCAATSPSATTWCYPRNPRKHCSSATCKATWCSS